MIWLKYTFDLEHDGDEILKEEAESFHQQIALKLRKKLVKCYTWFIAMHGG